MKRSIFTISVLLLAVLTGSLFAAAGPTEMEYDDQNRPLWLEDQLYIKFNSSFRSMSDEMTISSSGIPSVDATLQAFGVQELTRSFKQKPIPPGKNYPDLTRIYTVNTAPGANLEMAIRRLNADPNIVYAERVPAMYLDIDPDDPLFVDQWHFEAIEAARAWNTHKGEEGDSVIVIGICDSGLDWQHPDLNANVYHRLGEDADGDGVVLEFINGEWVFDPDDVNGVDDDGNGYVDDFIGWNFYATASGGENNDPDDPPPAGDHGSHVSGIAAGVTNNATGIASVSWNVKVMATSHQYDGQPASVTSIFNPYAGLIYLAENEADIINASWGGGGASAANAEVIEYINALGSIFVTSAGNTGGSAPTYPAYYSGSISVVSTALGDGKSSFSTFGYGHDISAPGSAILSTVPYSYQYDYFSGTSMASPMVAGLFALVKSYNPTWSNDELIRQVTWTTDNIDSENPPEWAGLLGEGRINAFKALTTEPRTPHFRLEMVELVTTNPAVTQGFLEAGETADLSFLVRNWTHAVGDSSVAISMIATDPDITVSTGTLMDTLFADDTTFIEGPFTITVDEGADTEASELLLVFDPQWAATDTLRIQVTVNTTVLSDNAFSNELVFGEIATDTLTITNSAPTPVNFTAVAAGDNSVLWHTDSYNAYEGTSWWVGNPLTGGYPDMTLQFMDLPPLDLSAASNPTLTFMADWAIEEANGDGDPFDGWDGANVWISTDGGDNFEVMIPVSPAYTAEALYAFGAVWGLGIVPGWTGQNGDYVPAEFDLSAYVSSEVVIRLAFASDPSVNNIGFFVDNIEVTDDNTSYFENYGTWETGIVHYGLPRILEPTDWVQFQSSEGTVPAEGSYDLIFDMNTRDLEDGIYNGSIFLLLNGEFLFGEVSTSLQVISPTYDVGITSYDTPDGSLAMLVPRPLSINMRNRGTSDQGSFQAVLDVYDDDMVNVFSDTTDVAGLNAGLTSSAEFAPFTPQEGSDYEFEFNLIGLNAEDYNDYNDSWTEVVNVPNLVDDFAEGNDLWSFDGWGLTTGIIGLGDIFSAHVDGGNIPYGDNLNTTMTWSRAIDVSELNNLVVKYHVIMLVEDGVDFGYFEASTDGVNWDQFNSHTGAGQTWTPWAIQLGDYIEGAEELYFRFRFESNESVGNMGLFIDNVELWTENYTSTEPVSLLPEEFAIYPNYPNPFNPSTTIRYALPEAAEVKLQIFDLRGRLVSTLVNTEQPAGYHQMEWHGVDASGHKLGTGIYLARVQAGDRSEVIKLALIK